MPTSGGGPRIGTIGTFDAARGYKQACFFFGGRDYLPLFCALTADIPRRTAFFNSKEPPGGVNCRTERYETTTKTNWHYECVHAFAAALRG